MRQAGAPALETGTSRVKAFFGARRAVTFSFRVTDGAAPGRRCSWYGWPTAPWCAPGPPPAAVGTVASVVWNGDLPRQAAPPGATPSA